VKHVNRQSHGAFSLGYIIQTDVFPLAISPALAGYNIDLKERLEVSDHCSDEVKV